MTIDEIKSDSIRRKYRHHMYAHMLNTYMHRQSRILYSHRRNQSSLRSITPARRSLDGGEENRRARTMRTPASWPVRSHVNDPKRRSVPVDHLCTARAACATDEATLTTLAAGGRQTGRPTAQGGDPRQMIHRRNQGRHTWQPYSPTKTADRWETGTQ